MDDRQGASGHCETLNNLHQCKVLLQVHEGWPARAILHPQDIILRIDGSPCPSCITKLQSCLRGTAGSTVELAVQVAGSSSGEGVKGITIVRRLPKSNKKKEVCILESQKRASVDQTVQVTASVFEKLLKDAAAAGDDEMTAALQAQIRAERDNFV